MILKVGSDDEAEAIIFTSGRHRKGDENEPVNSSPMCFHPIVSCHIFNKMGKSMRAKRVYFH